MDWGNVAWGVAQVLLVLFVIAWIGRWVKRHRVVLVSLLTILLVGGVIVGGITALFLGARSQLDPASDYEFRGTVLSMRVHYPWGGKGLALEVLTDEGVVLQVNAYLHQTTIRVDSAIGDKPVISWREEGKSRWFGHERFWRPPTDITLTVPTPDYMDQRLGLGWR